MPENMGFGNALNGLENETVIRVVGVGGGGGNAINRMVDDKVQGVEFIAINTDNKDLLRSEADVKISLSDEDSRGLGAGADPEKGAKAAQDHQGEIEKALQGSDMVFIVCGEGGGTGTGASPLVAHVAKELGALTVAVVTKPFSYEGPRRMESAERGIEKLRKEVDTIIVIPNDRLLDMEGAGDVPMLQAFAMADSALLSGIEGITDIINSTAYINTDFEDVKTIMKDAGTAFFGMATATGEDRAIKAAERAISSPLIEESIRGAHGALVNIAGSKDLGTKEISGAVEVVRSAISPEAQIINGLTFDDSFGDDIKVTVIIAGFDSKADKADDVSARSPLFQQKDPASNPEALSPQVPPLKTVRLDEKPEMEGLDSNSRLPDRDDDSTGDIDIPPFLR